MRFESEENIKHVLSYKCLIKLSNTCQRFLLSKRFMFWVCTAHSFTKAFSWKVNFGHICWMVLKQSAEKKNKNIFCVKATNYLLRLLIVMIKLNKCQYITK